MKDGQSLHVDDLIPSEGIVSADQFAAFVFIADGVDTGSDPEQWAGLKVALKTAFIDLMGDHAVDAALLR